MKFTIIKKEGTMLRIGFNFYVSNKGSLLHQLSYMRRDKLLTMHKYHIHFPNVKTWISRAIKGQPAGCNGFWGSFGIRKNSWTIQDEIHSYMLQNQLALVTEQYLVNLDGYSNEDLHTSYRNIKIPTYL